MEKERKIKAISIAALVVAVLCLTVAFAAMSQTLTINGYTYLAESGWDVKLQTDDGDYDETTVTTANALVYQSVNGEGEYQSVTFNENMSSISGFDFTLEKPGDFSYVAFNVANYSEVEAVLDNFEMYTPTCKSETGNTTDEELVCGNLIIKSYYPTGEGLDENAKPIFKSEIKIGDELGIGAVYNSSGNKSQVKHLQPVIYMVELDPELDTLPTGKVTVENLGLEFNYVQK